ncbi:hypothetical protein KSS87_003734 [Heliosperma pusillum]|nr:hypothetical protein KSS87_003734 [Heliosperma pusillum]
MIVAAKAEVNQKYKNRNPTRMYSYMRTSREYEFSVVTRVIMRSLVKLDVQDDLVVIASVGVPLCWARIIENLCGSLKAEYIYTDFEKDCHGHEPTFTIELVATHHNLVTYSVATSTLDDPLLLLSSKVVIYRATIDYRLSTYQPSTVKDYLNDGVELYKAALSGDWGAAAQFYNTRPYCFTKRITKRGDTALHIAAVAGRADFVSQLVNLLMASSSEYVLRLKNNNGNTALCFAAVSGVVAIAKAMVDRDSGLTKIRNKYELTPLLMAAMLGNRDMVHYLLSLNDNYDLTRFNTLPEKDQISLFISTINTDLYGKLLPPSTFAN